MEELVDEIEEDALDEWSRYYHRVKRGASNILVFRQRKAQKVVDGKVVDGTAIFMFIADED